MALPNASDSFDIVSQDHVEVRTSLQIARNRRNIREVVKGTRWWSRAIVEDPDIDALVSYVAAVPRKY